MNYRQCFCEYDVSIMDVRHKPGCPFQGEKLEYAVLGEAVKAQIEGAPIFEKFEPNKLDPRLREIVDEYFEKFGRAYAQVEREENAKSSEETNFGFYVDGYTLQSTEVVGEIRVTSYDGKTAKFPSKQLVAFLERRLSPPNITPEN